MAISKPVIVSVTEIGAGPSGLRVIFDYDIVAGSDLEGFIFEWNNGGPWTPSWSIPPAVDKGWIESDGGSPVQRRSVYIDLASGVVCDWETFEEYSVGENQGLPRGGSSWDGPWSTVETEIGYKGYGDDFESYAVGSHATLTGGKGWDGGWGGL